MLESTRRRDMSAPLSFSAESPLSLSDVQDLLSAMSSYCRSDCAAQGNCSPVSKIVVCGRELWEQPASSLPGSPRRPAGGAALRP